jgi:hypothetical protein
MDERADPSLDETAARVPRPLIPFDSREAVSLRQASKIAGKSESTMRTWCHRYHIGRRIGGVWAWRGLAARWIRYAELVERQSATAHDRIAKRHQKPERGSPRTVNAEAAA